MRARTAAICTLVHDPKRDIVTRRGAASAPRSPTPTPHNPMGAKGIGEAATIGSTPAVVNAVVDALKPFGVRHLDMPLRPERVWRTLQPKKRA